MTKPFSLPPSFRVHLLRVRSHFHCFSYSPLPSRLSTVNPAFLASEMESGLSLCGVLKAEKILRTGFLQAGHFVNSGALNGRRRVNLPPHTLHSPSHNSYS